jgi:hypothetical protein
LTPRGTGVSAHADRNWRTVSTLAALVALAAGLSLQCAAQEISSFRLTGVDGYATLRYLRDDFAVDQPAALAGTPAARLRQGQMDLREELFVMTHSYVYHPAFLTLDIGGGPILQRGRFTGDAGDNQSSGTLYNFTSRATFLRDKPYRGAVFFEHLNPTLSVAPGQVLMQENTRYGMEFALLPPVTPVSLQLDASRAHFQGRGADRIIDDQVSRMGLRATRSFGALGITQVQYQDTQQESSSGSPNLPIQGSTSSNRSLNVDSRLHLGANRQYDLTNLLMLNTQSYALDRNSLPDRRDLRFLLDLRGRHSREVNSFGVYSYSSSDQGDLTSAIHNASAGLNYWPSPELAAAAGVRGEDSATRQVSSRLQGVDGSLRYQVPLKLEGWGQLGSLQAGYGFRYDHREQQAAATQTNVIGERITVIGTSFASLSRSHVNSGSVVVSNATRSQTYLEGRDYVLTVVGVETRLQRLISGNIVDGQELLVDYAYDIGGSYAYNQADQNLNASWAFASYGNVYFRALDSAPRLTSGAPSFPLNAVQSRLYGARADLPLRAGLEAMIGGSLEREKRRETIAPYQRHNAEIYIQTEDPVFGAGNLRFSNRRTRLDYENAIQNMNLSSHELRYWIRNRYGMDISAAAVRERDIGGPIPRRRSETSLKAQWRYRKLSLALDVVRTREFQGDFERSRALIQFVARRDF